MFNNIQIHANRYISFIFQTRKSLYICLQNLHVDLTKGEILVQEIRIPSPAEYSYDLCVCDYYLFKINQGFMINNSAQRTSNKPKLLRHDATVSEIVTCVYSDRHNTTLDEK